MPEVATSLLLALTGAAEQRDAFVTAVDEAAAANPRGV